jgi:ribosomal protein S2
MPHGRTPRSPAAASRPERKAGGPSGSRGSSEPSKLVYERWLEQRRRRSMESVTVQQLIEAGVHFGCRVSRWNPKMAPFIYGRRNLIHIMDLRETLRGLLRAQNFLYHVAAEGHQILWVGTKRQVKGVIHDAGTRTGMPVVTERWIGAR